MFPHMLILRPKAILNNIKRMICPKGSGSRGPTVDGTSTDAATRHDTVLSMSLINDLEAGWGRDFNEDDVVGKEGDGGDASSDTGDGASSVDVDDEGPGRLGEGEDDGDDVLFPGE